MDWSSAGERPNTKHVVVRYRLDQNLGEATYGYGGDQVWPNMEAPDNVLTSLPLWWLCSSVVTGLLSRPIYCPPMSTPQLSSTLRYLLHGFWFTIYHFWFSIPNSQDGQCTPRWLSSILKLPGSTIFHFSFSVHQQSSLTPESLPNVHLSLEICTSWSLLQLKSLAAGQLQR